jgi:hypothetical protein
VKTGKWEPKDRWAAYLPAIVFTYREIQTWRADAWSRDLIRTLLRTNTLALCGYSGADPIMHATFREVYEERAAMVPTPTNDSASEDIEKAPVFFFGSASKREFHSLEILAAATAAVGLRADKPVDHPNLIEFETSGFPTVDDHFRLIAHGVLREIQYQSLVTRLRRLAPQILRHPCPDADYDALIRRFDALRKQERAEIDASGDRLTTLPAAERRRRFDHVVDWTWHFLPGFLRELTLADLVETRRGPGRALRQHRVLSSYQAASERPEWAAWAAIVELALREMVAVWSGATCGDPDPTNVWITAEESSHAAISFSCTKGPWQPQALLIRLAGFDRLGRSAGLNGAFKRVACWEFTERDLPWPLKRVKHDIRPDARTLWECAVGRPVGVSKVRRYLGAMS